MAGRGSINGEFRDDGSLIGLCEADGVPVGVDNWFTPRKTTFAAIMDAQARVLKTGRPGGVILEPDAYDLTGSGGIPLVQGVSYACAVPPVDLFSGDIADDSWTYKGGAVLTGGAADLGFRYNEVDIGSPDAGHFAEHAISGLIIKNIGFSGFKNPIKIGAANLMGAVHSQFENLWFLNANDTAAWHNMLHCEFKRLFSLNRNGTHYGGGFDFISSVSGALFIPGNSVLDSIYVLTGDVTQRSIRVAGLQGCEINEMVGRRLQANRYGILPNPVTATGTGAGNNITVPDGSRFPVGAAVRWQTGAIWYGDHVSIHFVKTNTSPSGGAATITLADSSYGAAQPPQVGTDGLYCLGFPHLELVNISNSDMGNADCEGLAPCVLLLDGALAGSSGISESSVSAYTQVWARVTTAHRCKLDTLSGITVDNYTMRQSRFDFIPIDVTYTLATGNTQALPDMCGFVYLEHAATLATLTLSAPANPVPGQVITVSAVAAVTTLTVCGLVATLAAGAAISMRYQFNKLDQPAWVRVG